MGHESNNGKAVCEGPPDVKNLKGYKKNLGRQAPLTAPLKAED